MNGRRRKFRYFRPAARFAITAANPIVITAANPIVIPAKAGIHPPPTETPGLFPPTPVGNPGVSRPAARFAIPAANPIRHSCRQPYRHSRQSRNPPAAVGNARPIPANPHPQPRRNLAPAARSSCD